MQRPNLILITIECWRGDHFGELTPCLSHLAEESGVFSDAYTAGGWTRISMTALMSSAYASMYGGSRFALATPQRRTLAECAIESGYWTAGFTANPVCGTSGGFHRGFGTFRDVMRNPPPLPDGAPSSRKEWRRLAEMGIRPRDLDPTEDAVELTDVGLRWLGNHEPDKPYLLWLHYLDPHWPFQMHERSSTPEQVYEAWNDRRIYNENVIPSRGRFDPGEDAGDRWKRKYREAVASTDLQIGRLLDALRARSDWDRTIVAVTGDHGEEFYERGTWFHGWNQLYREGAHVPLIIRLPGSRPQSVTEPVGLIDLAPTLLDYAGIPLPQSMMGVSLRSLMEGQSTPPRPVFTEMLGHNDSAAYRLAIRDREWKYIYDIENPHDSKLFRVCDDAGERRNLREQCPDTFRRFEQKRLEHAALGMTTLLARQPIGSADSAQRALENSRDPNPGQNWRNTDDAVLREHLEALGYL